MDAGLDSGEVGVNLADSKNVGIRAPQRREPPHDRAKAIWSRERLRFEAVIVLPP